MPIHPPQLTTATQTRRIPNTQPRLNDLWLNLLAARAVRPDPTRHVVARAQQHVAEMRAPTHLPHGVLVARQYGRGTLSWTADVEGPDQVVDACGGDDGGAVFVPVVGEGFGRGVNGLWR